MFGIVRSALAAIFGEVFRAAALKALLFGVLLLLISSFVPLLIQFAGIDDLMNSLSSGFGSADSAFWYWWDLFQCGYGFNVVIGAYITAFVIRRIPFFG